MNRRRSGIATGAVLAVTMRWTDRLLGVVSMLILARLLDPADFGIIAMSMIAIGLIDVLLDLGVSIALVQNRDATERHFNTAWTLRLIQAGAAAALMVALSGPAADYFRDDRVTAVMVLMSLGTLVGGLENIGTVKFQKEFQFLREFRYLFGKRLVTFVVTIAAAAMLRSYWALVLGTLVGRAAGVALSYMVHEYRPRLSLAASREMLGFSQWLVLRGVGAYLDAKVDQLALGRVGSASALGSYAIASEVSALPSTELLAPMSRVLFPAFVEARTDPALLERAFYLSLAVQALIGIPAGVGLMLVAREAVTVLLGSAWQAASPVIEVLALVNVISAINYGPGYLLLSSGKVKLLAMVAWLQLGVFLAVVFAFAPMSDGVEFATARLGAVATCFFLVLAIVRSNFDFVTWRGMFRAVGRPLLGAAAMVAALAAPAWPELPVLVLLASKVATGAIVYVAVVLLSWKIGGLAEGAESYLFGKINGGLAHLRSNRRKNRPVG